MMQYRFIINPKSGPGKNTRQLAEKIADRMKITGHAWDLAVTSGPGDATRLARQAAEEQTEIVVAVGGDGTVSEVAAGLIHSGSALGIIAMGSGNGIARSLNLPLRYKHALDQLLNADIVTIDAGEISGRYFFGISGMGFDARIGHKFQHFGVRGPIPYFIIGIREFLRYQPQELLLETGDRQITIRPLLLAIANTTQYGNGALIAPMADPRDGWFEICYLDNSSLWASVRAAARLFRGTIDKSTIYHHFRAQSFNIESRQKELIVHFDGEPRVMPGKLQVKLHPKALKVAVGKGVNS